MNIKFEKITIDNFMSIGHCELDLSDKGTVLVKGINLQDDHAESNGSGKSALTTESILWCLTGSTNKKAKTINNLFIKDSIAKVKLNFSVDGIKYEVERINDSLKSLKIIKNGKDISGNTYTKSKEILDTELGFINKEILTSIIILGQGLKDRFSELVASERKSRLEYLVGIDTLLANIQTSLENSEEEINSRITDTNLKITEQNTIINTSQQIIDNYKNRPVMSESEYKNNLDEYNKLADRGNECQQKIEKLKADIQSTLLDKDKLNGELVKLNGNITKAQSQISIQENSKKSIQSNIDSTKSQLDIAKKAECPTCHQHLQDDKIEKDLQSTLDKYEKELKDLEASNIKDLEKTIKDNQSKYDEINAEINTMQIKINENTSQQTKLGQELNEIGEQYNKYKKFLDEYDKYKAESKSYEQVSKDAESNIEKASGELDGLNVKSKKYSSDKDINKFFKNNVSRKFRNFLLEGVFNYLNEKLKYYSGKLFTDYIIKLENNGNNIDIRIGDKYMEDLSGGEGRKADLAIQFALRDLARNQRGLTCNLLCLDEVFDYLDPVGIQDITKFVEEETGDVSTMFITTHMKNIAIDHDGILEITKGKEQISTVKEI